MPRKPRCIEPGTTYHLISRFVDREWFIRTKSERQHYLRLLGTALECTDWRLMSYAIMSNHIHLGCVAGERPLHAWIRSVHAPFADAMNRAYNRIGVMFVRGPKAYAVSPDSVGSLLAYIHNNPVRAGLCATAAESSWTSHRAYIGRARVPPWLHVTEGLARAGFQDGRAFDAWVAEPAREENERAFTQQCRARVAQLSREARLEMQRMERQRRADAIVSVSAEILGITVAELQSSARCDANVVARRVAVRSAVAAGVTGEAIARALCLSAQRVSMLRHQPVSSEVRSFCAQVASRID